MKRIITLSTSSLATSFRAGDLVTVNVAYSVEGTTDATAIAFNVNFASSKLTLTGTELLVPVGETLDGGGVAQTASQESIDDGDADTDQEIGILYNGRANAQYPIDLFSLTFQVRDSFTDPSVNSIISSLNTVVALTQAGFDDEVGSLALTLVDETNPLINANQSFSYRPGQVENFAIGTVAAIDSDNNITSYAIASGNNDGFFAIDNTGNITLTAAGAAAAAASNNSSTSPNKFTLGVTATDADGNVSPTTDVTINVSDQTFSYAENQAADFQIGTVVDSTGTLMVTGYAIASGNDDGFFAIDSSGNLTLTATGAAAGTAVNDFETGVNTFNLDITISGNNGMVATSVTETVVVNVTDLNDTAPVFTSSATFSVAENTTAVGTITAADQDTAAATFTFTIVGGADSTAFTLDPNTGALSFNTAPDFENPTDSGANNVFDIQVQASDGTNTSTQDVTVNVTDVADPLTGMSTDVFRFFRPGSNAHLYTRDLNEVAFFRTRTDIFSEEGVAFRAGLNDNTGTLKAVRRFYNTRTDGHFFTLNEVEIASVLANQVAQGIFRDEGIAFYAVDDSVAGGIGSDIFRFSNIDTGAHFFTNSIAERDIVLANQVAQGFFRFEGVGWEGAQP